MDGLSTVPPDQARACVDRGKLERISNFITPEHKRTAKMLGYTLFLGDASSYGGLSIIARHHLTLAERGGLSCAFLGSMPEGSAMQAAATVLGATGDPLPPFLGGMEDARHWASWATDAERKAYALACYEAMTPRDQAAFFRHISTVEVAA